ncbi:MAG: hypothetical protein ACAI35_18195 [Candidatus Methylacidiphilales bacterium]|nr:hypothetical protein [Candidatus Methylacidiphilales bacterium]
MPIEPKRSPTAVAGVRPATETSGRLLLVAGALLMGALAPVVYVLSIAPVSLYASVAHTKNIDDPQKRGAAIVIVDIETHVPRTRNDWPWVKSFYMPVVRYMADHEDSAVTAGMNKYLSLWGSHLTYERILFVGSGYKGPMGKVSLYPEKKSAPAAPAKSPSTTNAP